MSDLGEGPRRRYGVVLFDDVEDPTTGWASVEGAMSYQVKSMHDLPGDTLWLTNLNYDGFKNSNVSLNPSMRMETYLPVKLKDMLAEWGLDPVTTSTGNTASFCSSLFQRIMSMAWKVIRECNPSSDRMRAFTTDSLRDDMRHLIPNQDFPPDEIWHAFQENQAFKNFTKTTNRSDRGAAMFMLRRPRLAHVLDVLSSPIPKGPFSFVPSKSMRGGGDRVNWVRASDRPCLVNVAVLGLMDGVPREVGDMFAFSNTMNKADKQQRMWVPHPEFMVMSDFTKMDILGAWVGNDYSVIGPKLPEPVREFLSNKYSEMSWSAGIVADAILKAAIMGPPPDRKAPQAKDRGKGPKTSWQGAWLRAADRMLMFTSAMAMANDGFSVQSYGVGWVSCSAIETQVRELMHKAMSVGLVPTFNDVPDDAFKNGSIPWNGDRRSAAMAVMTVTKQKTRLWNIDRMPLYEKDRQDEMLRKIMKMPGA